MQTIVNIDKSGRIVIPKELRDEFGFTPDQSLTMERAAEGVLIRPVSPAGCMVRRGNLMVYHTDGPPANFDVVEFIHQLREERIQQIIGPGYDGG